ncbi:competence protein ComK [Salinibacillus xinjiangensis]|uniref:Competence protein n=1 Tax=Salinibacillus xinjiangensis TaxID=1229268 RepID=A0A6G1X9F7_9BACI|nr:competence protein ComK [Salinibacillus xinjiangensis]MRG87643.1 competence protein [Salinibacillus xinjiangensis]
MKKILNDYFINESTLALLPATHHEYDTIVLVQDQKLYVRKTPLQLIKKACLEAGSSFNGRREAVIYQTSFFNKVPIPILPSRDIYAFPTHSPSDFQCQWIFYNHVQSIKTNRSPSKPSVKSIIIFKNEHQLSMRESYYLLEKQMQRTAICILQHRSFLDSLFTKQMY